MSDFAGVYSRNYWKYVAFFLIFYQLVFSEGGSLQLGLGLPLLATGVSIVLLAGGLEIAAGSILMVYLYYRVGRRLGPARFCLGGSAIGGLAGAIHYMTPIGAFTGLELPHFIANGACSGVIVSFTITKVLPHPETLREQVANFEKRMVRRATIPLALAVIVLVWWASAFVGLNPDNL